MKIYSSETKETEILTVEDWFNYCPPKQKEKHWVDGRSAKEMAKFWMNEKKRNDFQIFIQQAIANFNYGYSVPEYESAFDSYGSPRQHDLLISSADSKTVITIEGKADEPFGKMSFDENFNDAFNKKKQNDDSKAFDRMVNLAENYFKKNEKIKNIMYQLAYWFSGSICDVIKFDAEKVVMVLQEFRSKLTTLENLDRNHQEFEKFVEFISTEQYSSIKNKQILGPINNLYTNGKNLYIGYYSINLE
jgi:hypothetical protein